MIRVRYSNLVAEAYSESVRVAFGNFTTLCFQSAILCVSHAHLPYHVNCAAILKYHGLEASAEAEL